MLFTLLAFVVALGILITFHELGHYWVARRCGVKVLRFSVGFGKVMASRVDRNGTQWALSAIPLGGYVKMLDDPVAGGDPALNAQAFNSKSVAQRFAIVLAGPVANLLLAVILYAMLGLAGTREPAAVLAAPPAHSPAAVAGLAQRDRIESVDGAPVRSWTEVRWHLLDVLAVGGRVELAVLSPDGRRQTHVLTLPAASGSTTDLDPMEQAGLSLAAPRPLVSEVTADSPGAAAGLHAGDVVLAVGGQVDPSPNTMVHAIQAHAGQPLALAVRRDGAVRNLTVTPQAAKSADGKSIGRIGVMLSGELPMVTVRYGLVQSLQRGLQRTFDTAWLSLKMMGRMVVGKVSLSNISGPVTIADYAGQTARVGLAAYLGFLALISVSIGILNLLPIPLLDGGHLMYYVLEIVRGKPVPESWLETGQKVGLGLLGALMVLAFFNDFSRLFS
ncbi:RIP metalloprotease RseP [Candidimonas nitroreducens]|uniref:Zinc metalloprotease n=1 Tax=Candidimonas nitroreducens TaxID=683354 RepID=A0A225N379_9BURK|nr:RIP metalloprotease RseP [Candidimonas nitroreducens]OWT65489.1 RIP metalloprotease RseP [Candidimonas nitroreducens]